ncbi:MAG: efflux RND transporter periplasmic adaptor subunit [Armatimonadota bacterium]
MGHRKARYVAVLAAVILIAAIVVWRTRERGGPPSDQLYGNGIIETIEVDVSAKVAGKLTSLRVDEGDSVRTGDLIAELDSGELVAQVQRAEAALSSAQANLAELLAGTRPEDLRRAQAQYQAALQVQRQAQAQYDLVRAGPRAEEIAQLRAGVEQAEFALADAERELVRLQGLEDRGAVARQQVDLQRTRRDTSAAQLEAARQRLRAAEVGSRPQEIAAARAALAQARDQAGVAKAALDLAVAGPRPQTIAAARGAVAQTEAALSAARTQLGYSIVRAPVDGAIIVRPAELGELVTPGMPIVRISVTTRPWLRVYVPETDLGRVKLGQRADVTTDTYPGKSYPGRVVEIAEQAEFTPKNVQTREERVKLVFGVKIEVENQNHELKPGMPADAVIYTGR